MARWLRYCQDCWQVRFPDEYFPDNMDSGTCADCGEEHSLTGAHA